MIVCGFARSRVGGVPGKGSWFWGVEAKIRKLSGLRKIFAMLFVNNNIKGTFDI